MNFNVFLTLFYPIFLTSIAVGPVFITLANISISYGIKASLFAVIGVSIGNIIYMIIGILTAQSLIVSIPSQVMLVVSFLATCLLIKIAIGFWKKDISNITTQQDFAPSVKTIIKMCIITLSSPVVIAGYSITFLTFASSVKQSLFSSLLGGVCAAILAYTLIAVVFGAIGNNIKKLGDKTYFKLLKILNKTAGMLLCGFASLTIKNFVKEILNIFVN